MILTFNYEGRPVWFNEETGEARWCVDPLIATPEQISQALEDIGKAPYYGHLHSGSAMFPTQSGVNPPIFRLDPNDPLS